MKRADTLLEPAAEYEVVRRINSGEVSLAPASLTVQPLEGTCSDAYVEQKITVNWGPVERSFAFKYTPSSKPASIDTAIQKIRRSSENLGLAPLILVPYLSEEAIRTMENAGVNGIDLCGNASILADGLALRSTGNENRFTESQPLRSVYRGTVSLPTRALLLKGRFGSLTELREYILGKIMLPVGTSPASKVTKGTISKVVKLLCEDALVYHSREEVKVVSPSGILNALNRSYVEPRARRVAGKIGQPLGAAFGCLRQNGVRAAATGASSASYYGLLTSNEPVHVYVDNIDIAAEALCISPTRVFQDIVLVEERADTAYFDCRTQDGIIWASTIQCWLELSNGGPRERDAAAEFAKLLTSLPAVLGP